MSYGKVDTRACCSFMSESCTAETPTTHMHRASRCRVQVSKNKVAPPYKLAEFDILFGSGISSQGCLLDAAEAVGIVTKKGSWYYYGEERLAQGRDKTLQELDERKELAQWVTTILTAAHLSLKALGRHKLRQRPDQ